MSTSHLTAGTSPPSFIYGTAWKKDQTKTLVKQALEAGFRKIDTAAQPRHYQEHLVGAALREAYAEGLVKRSDLYVQTKYTTPAGQDMNNMPYHPLDPLETQIRTSIASSLKNFRSRDDEGDEEDVYLDCVLLHSPLPTIEQTLQAWRILETYVPGRIRALGISNVTLPVLQAIYENSQVKPSAVQNRFYPATKYDVPLRAFCQENGITYQSFWTLTGNPKLLRSEPVGSLAKAIGIQLSVVLYALVMDLGVVVLNGTKRRGHMDEDLAGVKVVREWAENHEREWGMVRSAFSRIVEPGS